MKSLVRLHSQIDIYVKLRIANKATKIDCNLPLNYLHYFDSKEKQKKPILNFSSAKFTNKQLFYKFANPSIYDAIKVLISVDKLGFQWDLFSTTLFTKADPVSLRNFWIKLCIKCGSWNDIEKERIKDLVQKHGSDDWNIISTKMDKQAYFCRHYWTLYLGPLIELESKKWETKDYTNLLKNVNKDKFERENVKTEKIVKFDFLGCYIKYYMENKNYLNIPWSSDEEQLLWLSMQTYLENLSQIKVDKWEYISSIVKSRTPEQCKERLKNEVVPSNFIGPWHSYEESIFKDLEPKANLKSFGKIKTRSKTQKEAYFISKFLKF